MTNPIALAVALTAALALPAWADTLSTEGTPPWEMCGECHGLDGLGAVARLSDSDVDALAGALSSTPPNTEGVRP